MYPFPYNLLYRKEKTGGLVKALPGLQNSGEQKLDVYKDILLFYDEFQHTTSYSQV